MTPNNFGEDIARNSDLHTFRFAIRTDGGDDSGRAAADQASAIGARERPILTTRLRLYMTATWGS